MIDRGQRESVENYLETILILKKRKGLVRSIDVVNEMEFTKPSVSVAMKKLREAGLVEVDREGHLTLTEEGQERAERVYERHRVLEEAFCRLGVPPEIAREDACRVEHVLHEESFQRIKEHVKMI